MTLNSGGRGDEGGHSQVDLDFIIPASLCLTALPPFLFFTFSLYSLLMYLPLPISLSHSHFCFGILPLHLSDFWNG